MGSNSATGVPAKTRQETVPEILAGRLTHRKRALLDQAFDELDKRRKDGKGDVVAVLADQIIEDPLSALERIAKMLPQQPGAGGNPLQGLNIGALYLGAVQQVNERQAQPQPVPLVVDHEPTDEW